MKLLGLFRVVARPAVKIPVLERGRVLEFVNFLDYEYYMFFMPKVIF